MNRWQHILAAAVLMLMAGPALADGEKFTPLFDGKTFQGWEGSRAVFRIENGAIVGGRLDRALPHNEFLCTKKEYGNFELRLKCKLLGKTANGGIQIRSRRVPHHYEVSGYQADMAEQYWGNLYDESRRDKTLAGPSTEVQRKIVRDGDWNDYVIRCQGRHIQLWLNGRQTVDYREPDETMPQKGIIAVQIHGGPASEAWYKDIVIRPLSD